MDNFESIVTVPSVDASLAWDDDFDVAYRSADAILAHPRFADARLAYFDQLDRVYGENPFLNKLMMQAGRMMLFFLIICLEAGYREEDRASWPTLANILRMLKPMGVASEGHVSQLIGRLVHVGFLSTRPSPVDARVRLLGPTPAMLAHDQDWLIAHYAPLATLYGSASYSLPMSRNGAFQIAQRGIAAQAFAKLAAPLLDNPIILFFGVHDAAFLILTTLAGDASRANSDSATVPYAALARRFSVSRTHVRRILAEAQANGWVQLAGARERSVVLQPPLLQALDRFIAEAMSNHDRTGRAAERLLLAASDRATN
ncbi:hypothetical protein [Sphingomonas sp. 28-63-12]|uniref:hypothetical protein n=1 Tax=Sphingomonas sp. 28-63-12 TaxID=1970434 RepID=UPI000BCE0CDC|nr:MAG: hypothetical protein B7Y47_02910 [Sphingomonas sp. 28-63-12]